MAYTRRTPAVTARDVRTAGIYALVVLVLYVAGVGDQPLLAGLTGGTPLWPGPVSLVLMLVAAALTLLRTSRPEVLLTVGVPLALAELLLGSQMSAYILLAEFLWVPVARGSARLARAATWTGVVVGAGFGTLFFLAVGASSDVPWTTAAVLAAMVVALVVATPLAWAREVRQHRIAQEAAEALATAEHELAGERAAREIEADRLRIAQDLHDVVAGHLTAVTLHTSLAGDLADPDARDRSLETARTSAEAALRDLRAVIGVLSRPTGGDADSVTRQPTLSWDILRRRLGEDATVSIDPAVGDPDTVSADARTVLLHIGAEAVTNAVRHGDAPRELRVGVTGGDVTLTCRNRTAGSTELTSTTRSTLGLQTMDTRARTVGGTLTAGPDTTGTWTVTATVPRAGQEGN